MKQIILTLLFAGLFQLTFAQPAKTGTVPRDNGATEMVSMGKRYLKNNNYTQAIKMFEDALSRPYNQSTTAAIYLSGMCYYYLNDLKNAGLYFNQVITEFPLSKYGEEAKYHLALMRVAQQEELIIGKGMEELLRLHQDAVEGEISKECLNSFKYHALNTCETTTLENLYNQVPEALKKDILEILCYRLVSDNRKADAKKLYTAFKNEGKDSNFLSILLAEKKKITKIEDKNIVKIAVFLPLFIDGTNVEALAKGEIPEKSQVALDIYEGLQRSIEEYSAKGKKRVYLKVFDTQRENTVVEKQLQELETLYPDLIIGEIYNKQSRVIGDWAERKGIPQIVPVSPTGSLVAGKKNVFLLRPSAAVHGKRMAEHAFMRLGAKNAVVWNDRKSSTKEMVTGFKNTFEALGGTIKMIEIDSIPQKSINGVPYYIGQMGNPDIVYFPIASADVMGAFLTGLGSKRPRLMMHPDVEAVSSVEREVKERLGILYTNSYLPNEDSNDFVKYYNEHLSKYNIPPSENNLRGYDMGSYLLQVIDDAPDMQNLSKYLRESPRYKGILIDYNFDGEQDNQAIHIMKFSGGGAVKVN
ncbi:MAG: ABC transporter substrate-binding protein [Bacteroidia bacterium]